MKIPSRPNEKFGKLIYRLIRDKIKTIFRDTIVIKVANLFISIYHIITFFLCSYVNVIFQNLDISKSEIFLVHSGNNKLPFGALS